MTKMFMFYWTLDLDIQVSEDDCTTLINGYIF